LTASAAVEARPDLLDLDPGRRVFGVRSREAYAVDIDDPLGDRGQPSSRPPVLGGCAETRGERRVGDHGVDPLGEVGGEAGGLDGLARAGRREARSGRAAP